MRTDSGKRNDHTNRSTSWDDTGSLGWQLWLRTLNPGLSSKSIQRQIERFRSTDLSHLPSLAAEIQRRWQYSQGQESYPANSELPLFSARYSFPYNRAQEKHFQVYPQPGWNFPTAHPSPSRSESPRLSTTTPQTKAFPGQSILRKKETTGPTQQAEPIRNMATPLEQPAANPPGLISSDDTEKYPSPNHKTTPLAVGKKKIPELEPIQFISDKISYRYGSVTSIKRKSVPKPDVRHLMRKAPQHKAFLKIRETAPPTMTTPLVHMSLTENLFNLPSQKGKVQNILGPKPEPNLFHTVSHDRTEDSSPAYFSGPLKFSNPSFNSKTPLLYRTPLQGKTNYEKDGITGTFSNGNFPLFTPQKEKSSPKFKTVMRKHADPREQADPKISGQPGSDIIKKSDNRTNPIKYAVHDALSFTKPGSLGGFSIPLTSQPLKEPMAFSKPAVLFPLSRKQNLTVKELTVAGQIPDTIGTWLSPASYSIQNRQSTHPKYEINQQLPEPVKTNTPNMPTLLPQSFSSFSSLTLPLADRVSKDIMRAESYLRNPYDSERIFDLSENKKSTGEELFQPSADLSTSVSHTSKPVTSSPQDQTSFPHFSKPITDPAKVLSGKSFTLHQPYPRYSRISLFGNDVPKKKAPLLSPNVLRHEKAPVKTSNFPSKNGLNNIAGLFMTSRLPYSMLHHPILMKSDKTAMQRHTVKGEIKEVTEPVKGRESSRHFTMDVPVSPANSRATSANMPYFSNNSPIQDKTPASPGFFVSPQLEFSQIQRKSTKSKTQDGFNIPHNLMVQQQLFAHTESIDIYGKKIRYPSLNVTGNHILLSKARTIPSAVRTQTGIPDSSRIVGRHANAPLNPEGRTSADRLFTKSTSSNLAPKLLLKWSAPLLADKPLIRQTMQGHSEEASSRERPFGGQDMPLAPIPSSQGRVHSSSNNASDGGIVQTSPLSPAAQVPSAAGVVSAPPVDSGVENTTNEAETVLPQAAMDLDELVEKTWLKIMRKLTIERERRGHPKWI